MLPPLLELLLELLLNRGLEFSSFPPFPFCSTASQSNLSWSISVCSRVKEAPTRRSISCLASTALASASLGGPREPTARAISGADSDEKRARSTLSLGLTDRQASITSNAMFSPSRSQSSHRISVSAFRAHSCRLRSTGLFSSRTRLATGAE